MKKLITRFASFGLATTVVGVLVVILSGQGGFAQDCANFWVNPQTGAQECLDSITNPRPAVSAPSGGSTNGSPGGESKPQDPSAGVSTTVSSTEVNKQYANQRFTMAPASQISTRLPIASRLPEVSANAAASVTGSPGAATASGQSRPAPSSFGTAQVAFTGSRVLGGTTNPAQTFPYAITGKLYMAFGGTTFNYVCSASLIGKSVLLTAAHCVHDYGRGAAGFARRVRFVPAKTNASEPFSFFESSSFLIPSVYFNGTDTCSTRGVVCNNDIALVSLGNNSAGQQAGNLVGYYGYGWNNYSYAVPGPIAASAFGNKLFAAITQLGYPGSHDSGLVQQINNSYGAYAASGNLKNTWLGSAMTGGSSGGPWLVNLGIDAAGANYGSDAVRNVVVGVTSWGYTSSSIKLQGASSFGQNIEYPAASYGTRGAGNIGKLVFDACDNTAGWRLQSQGRCR